MEKSEGLWIIYSDCRWKDLTAISSSHLVNLFFQEKFVLWGELQEKCLLIHLTTTASEPHFGPSVIIIWSFGIKSGPRSWIRLKPRVLLLALLSQNIQTNPYPCKRCKSMWACLHRDTHIYEHACSTSGLGGPCQNILVTAPHTQLTQGNTSPICFPNSWYIIHSVIHIHTHTHHTLRLIIIQVYPWVGLKFIHWGCRESLVDIRREVTLHCKYALSAYSFIYYTLLSHHSACQQ